MNSAETAKIEQGDNRVETGLTNDQLAAKLVLDASERWPEKTLAVTLLQALCRLTLEQNENTEGFTSIHLCEEVERETGRSWLSDEPSKKVRTYWKKLTDLWEQKQEGLRQKADNHSLDGYPELDRQEGGGTGNPTRYRLMLRPSPNHAKVGIKEPKLEERGHNEIIYICEDLIKPGVFARLFHKGLVFHGWRRAVVVALVGTALLVSYLLFILLLLILRFTEWPNAVMTTGGILVILWAIWASLGPIARLPDRRIVVAPWWMQSKFDDRLLIWWKDGPDAHRMIKAARYTAECPRCGGTVAAKKGGLAFWGRIVGRCEEAPEEHVYSFDHITREGQRLR